MFSKTKAKRLALGFALALALAAAPQALAAPGVDSDLGGAVYGWLADLWQSVRSVAATDDEMDGAIIRNGAENDSGPLVGSNGRSSGSVDEAEPWATADGDRNQAEGDGDEFSGPMVIPNG